MAKRDLPKTQNQQRRPQTPTPRPQRATENGSSSSKISKNWWLGILAVLAITAIIYLPSLDNDYVNWDDDVNIAENKNLEGVIDDQAISNIFDLEKGNVIGNYNPLPIYTFALEKKWSGQNKLGGKFDPQLSHKVNLWLHLGTTFFVILLGRALGLGLWGSLFLGLLFGFHPMRVESVAWATERKDVLFAIFYFAALWIYTKWIRTEESGRRVGFYILMIGLAVLSGLSKVQSVSLPLSMLAIDLWLRRPIGFKLILEKLPFWGISLAVGLVNLHTLKMVGSTEDDQTNYSFGERLLVGTYSFFTYLYKLFVPYPMSPMYPYERKLPAMAYVSPLIFIGFWVFVWWMWKRSNRSDESAQTVGNQFFNWKNDSLAWVFGALFFMFNVMFLLQVFGAGQGYLADRFTYVAYFGFFFVLAYFFEKFRSSGQWTGAALGAAVVFLLMSAVLTHQQIKVWKNGETLWTKVIEHEGKTIALCWGNRARYYRESEKNFEKALADYTTAIEISPDRTDNLNSRGKTYFDMAMSGKYNNRQAELVKKAIADYQNALTKSFKKAKDQSEVQANLGAALAAAGQFEQAIAQLSAAIQTEPENKNAYLNRSLAYFSTNQFDKAIADHSKILEIEPKNANIWYERGMCKNVLKQFDGAVSDLQKAISLDPNIGVAYLELAKAKVQMGDQAGARAEAQKAVQRGVKLKDNERAAFGM